MIKLNSTSKMLALLLVMFSMPALSYGYDAWCTNCGSSDYYVSLHYTFVGSYRESNAGCGIRSRLLQGGTNGGGIGDCANNVFSNVQSAGPSTYDFNVNLGPSYNKNIYYSVFYDWYDWATVSCGGVAAIYNYYTECRSYTTLSNINTAAIKSPSSISVGITNVTSIPNLQFSRITWNKGSDIPDANLFYRVYRDGVLLATLPASARAYNDSSLLQNGTYNYAVTTCTNDWGGHESPRTGYGRTITNNLMVATDATTYGRSRLTWPNIAVYAPNDIEVRRNGQQIAVVNKNSTAYNDFDGVAGVRYQYSIAPIDANNQTPFAFSDSGSSRPNGVLSGYVRSILGTGVQGVTLTATGTVGGTQRTYTAVSDAVGYYKIGDIFYDTLATYTVVPSKGTDRFNPPSISRALDLINYNNTLADIYDTTVFTVSGKVTFNNTNGCPILGAKLFLNGANQNISTDAAGNYSFIAQEPGNYQVGFQYNNHTFDSTTRTVFVTGNTGNVNFKDTKRDTLVIDLKGGCNNQIVDSAHFQVISDPAGGGAGCFDSTYHFNGFDPVVLILPAQKYRVRMVDAYDPVTNLNIRNSLAPIDLDLTKRDTVKLTSIDTVVHYRAAYIDTISAGVYVPHAADTTTSIDTITRSLLPYRAARFVYHGPLAISLTNVDSTCIGYVVEQNVRIPMGIYVKENSYYHNNVTSCFQDTGTVRIYDDVSGAGLSYAQLVNGRVIYPLIAGQPNVPDAPTSPHRYQKLFNVFVSAGSQPANLDAWMTITGDKTLSATYVSKTPPMPLMVLHDPPGSNSFSSYEKDSSFALNVSNSFDNTLNNGGYLGIQVGKTFTIPFGGAIPGAYFSTSLSGSDGTTTSDNKSTTINFTATQTIATSGDDDFVGREADVYIGGTVNTKYAKAYTLEVNSACQVVVDTVLIWGMDSVTSQFVYTGKHIKNTLLVQLADLVNIAPDTMKSYFQNQINMWKQVLRNDSIAIASSNYTRNISFSSGVSYDYTAQQDTGFENSYTYVTTRDINFSVGAGISDAELIDINAGYNLDFHTEDARNTTTSGNTSTIFTYHLEDRTPGNFFSVDIGGDKNFGSPIFKIFAGTSACPHEEGTQFRDVPTLSITPGAIINVPATQPASFVALIGNQSESSETRTYNVQLDGGTNFDGAVVKIGGQNITQSPASFTIPANQSINAALTVEKGPFADYYQDLGITISSPCDEEISKTVPITVRFQSACSDVDLALPTNNWLVNAANHDTLVVAFGGYNSSNPNLQEIGLQYRVAGSPQGWLNGPVLPVSALNTPYKTIQFNVTNIPDGNYEIRAYAMCLNPPPPTVGGVLSYTYSPTLSGVVDRTGFALYGTPQPANGVLNRGDNISIQFNEAIDCNQFYGHITTKLRRSDNGNIVLSTFTCTSNGLIITTNPPSLLDSLNNVVLTATVDNVYDANGNGLGSPVEWSFLVNRSEVYWSPSNMNITSTVGSNGSGVGTLLNKATSTKAYSITRYPSWLTPSKLSDSITANGLDSIRFTVSAPLNPGTYIDTVIASVGGFDAKLYVKLDVVNPSPNWTVNPASFQYSMNVTTNFSLTNLNAPLSTDKRDMIAAFKGEECRGVAPISFDAFTNSYVAFLTAYSNSASGDSFTFRIWDAMPGTEYQAKERQVFIDNATIGQARAPFILHPEGVFQTVTMTPGWNWFSLNVRSANMSVSNVLARLKADSTTLVKTDNSYSQYTVSQGRGSWLGGLSAMTTNKSYMLYLNHADTIHFLGQPITDTSRISVAAGWNWIGYPRQTLSDASSFLRNANAANGDVLKTQTQFTQYNGGGWSGSLNYMYPGQGYKLKTANAFNFVVPPSRSLPSWTVEDNLYQQNQTVTAELQFNGSPTTQSHYLVGAFAGNTCIGTAQPLFIPSLNVYRVFLTLHGDTANANQAISFKVYDTDNDIEFVPTYDAISVAPDTTVARVQAPYVINVQTTTGVNAIRFNDGFSLLQNVPNPFSTTTTIDYVIPTPQHVTITVYDESGRIVAELLDRNQDAGVHQVPFSQENLQSGVYFYQMKAGDFVKTRRMLIIK